MPRSLIHEWSFHCNGITVYLSVASADGLKFARGSTLRRHCRQLINIASGWLTYYRRKTDGVAGLRDGEARERKVEKEKERMRMCMREREGGGGRRKWDNRAWRLRDSKFRVERRRGLSDESQTETNNERVEGKKGSKPRWLVEIVRYNRRRWKSTGWRVVEHLFSSTFDY